MSREIKNNKKKYKKKIRKESTVFKWSLRSSWGMWAIKRAPTVCATVRCGFPSPRGSFSFFIFLFLARFSDHRKGGQLSTICCYYISVGIEKAACRGLSIKNQAIQFPVGNMKCAVRISRAFPVESCEKDNV